MAVAYGTTKADRRTTRTDAAMEGRALCHEVGSSVERLGTAITRRSWQGAHDEWSRLGDLVDRYSSEFLRLAGEDAA